MIQLPDGWNGLAHVDEDVPRFGKRFEHKVSWHYCSAARRLRDFQQASSEEDQFSVSKQGWFGEAGWVTSAFLKPRWGGRVDLRWKKAEKSHQPHDSFALSGKSIASCRSVKGGRNILKFHRYLQYRTVSGQKETGEWGCGGVPNARNRSGVMDGSSRVHCSRLWESHIW